MSKRKTPQSLPIAERVRGHVSRVGAAALLSARYLEEGDPIAQGDLIIRYGITYLGKPHLSIVPDLVVADYGELLSGEGAWDFLMQSGHLYPRADVCGRRIDGEDDMIPLKLLDFDYPYDVFAYHQVEARRPFAKLASLIAPDPSAFPERLLKHLPRYESLSEWRANG